jgi:hypothetical protein
MPRRGRLDAYGTFRHVMVFSFPCSRVGTHTGRFHTVGPHFQHGMGSRKICIPTEDHGDSVTRGTTDNRDIMLRFIVLMSQNSLGLCA